MEEIAVARQTKASSDVGMGMAAGALLGAGAGLVISALTVPSLALVAQASVVGLIIGGVSGAVGKGLRADRNAIAKGTLRPSKIKELLSTKFFILWRNCRRACRDRLYVVG